MSCQIPEKFQFQLIARDANGNIYTEEKIEIKINIVETEHNGYAPYIERHIVTTTNTGLANIIIGGGIVEKGSLKDVDWFNKANFLEIWINNNFTSSIQMVAVPYAMAVKKATFVNSTSYLDIKNRPRIPTDIVDLTDKNSILFDGDYNSLVNRPSIFDGDYNNLSNKPVIPTDLSDLTDNTALLSKIDYTKIKNKPTIFDGDYNSLLNKPTIPTDINQLTDINSKLFSGDYNDLTNKPNINQSFTGDYSELVNKPVIHTDLSTLADATNIWKNINFNLLINKPELFDGSYNSLKNVPDIPSDLSELTDNTNMLFDKKFSSLQGAPNIFSGKYNDLTNKPDIPTDFSDFSDVTNGIKADYTTLKNKPIIPTKLSELEKDINFLETEEDGDTQNELQNLSNVMSKGTSAGYVSITNVGSPLANSDAATKSYASALLDAINQMESTLNTVFPRPSVTSMKNNGLTVQEMLDEGYTIGELINNSITIAECKAGGVTLHQLLVGGASVSDLYNAGFAATDIVSEGINPELLKNAGLSVNELFNAGVTVEVLYKIGFNLEQILSLDTNLDNLKGTVTDTDNNTYNWKGIGKDIWFIENLKVKKFNNGDNITKTHIYNNNNFLLEQCGRMYLGTDIRSGKNVCPTGWKVPTEQDFIKMRDYIGKGSESGQSLKSKSKLWKGGGGSDDVNFTAEPYGYYTGNKYEGFSEQAVFWTLTPHDGNYLKIIRLWYPSVAILIENKANNAALYVRCIKEH